MMWSWKCLNAFKWAGSFHRCLRNHTERQGWAASAGWAPFEASRGQRPCTPTNATDLGDFLPAVDSKTQTLCWWPKCWWLKRVEVIFFSGLVLSLSNTNDVTTQLFLPLVSLSFCKYLILCCTEASWWQIWSQGCQWWSHLQWYMSYWLYLSSIFRQSRT